MESLNPSAPDFLPNCQIPTFYSSLTPPVHHLQPFFSVNFSHHIPLPSPEIYYCLPSPATFHTAAARKELEVVYLTAELFPPPPPPPPPYHIQRATLTLLGDGDDDKKLAAADGGAKVKSGPRKYPRRKYIAKRLQVETLQLDPTILGDHRTTVMIKNIPNKFTKKTLLDILDGHCFFVNEEITKGNDTAIPSEFDFLYLPIDFKSESNKGYAFVNFTSSVAAKRLYDSFHSFKWNTCGSRKTCEVVYARIQGKEALVQHFWNSTFPCSRSEYLPACFTPPRSGGGASTGGEMTLQEFTIGRMGRYSMIKSS